MRAPPQILSGFPCVFVDALSGMSLLAAPSRPPFTSMMWLEVPLALGFSKHPVCYSVNRKDFGLEERTLNNLFHLPLGFTGLRCPHCGLSLVA